MTAAITFQSPISGPILGSHDNKISDSPTMSVTQYLDGIQEEFPECEVIAFVDLDACLVLRANSTNTRPQEWLDRLGTTGADVLNGSLAQAYSEKNGRVNDAVIQAGDRVFVFVRSPIEVNDALCISCHPGADISALTDLARAALSAIAESPQWGGGS